jgi:U3 small nucleolar RNA-associated protein 20
LSCFGVHVLNKMPASSEDERGDSIKRPAKRQKRHKFKSSEQQVAEVRRIAASITTCINICTCIQYKTLFSRLQVDIDDVFRSLGPKRAEPLPGSSSFFQEALGRWRELCAAADWAQAAALLTPLTHTLPQLLHHQTNILDILLSRCTMAAAQSLAPLLDLVAQLARDLQADFLPHLPRTLGALADLVDRGADRDPDALQAAFSCLGLMIKHLLRQLASDPGPALRGTARLRHHRSTHVRALAAQALGHLLRHAQPQAASAAAKATVAEAVTRPTEARVEGAGLLLAAAVAGTSHSLHSRAPALLAPLLKGDLLSAADFKASGSKAPLEEDVVRARVAAVASICVASLLDHLRRGSGAVLWRLAEEEAAARLDDLEAVQGECKEEERMKARRAAARSVGLVAQMVEYYRGSRIDDYAPLFALASRLAAPAFSSAAQGEEYSDEGGLDVPAIDPGEDGLWRSTSLPRQALRLMKAVALGHWRVVGASTGPVAVGRVAPVWGAALSHAPVADALSFTRAIISTPAGYEIARFFGPQALGVVGRCILRGGLPIFFFFFFLSCSADVRVAPCELDWCLFRYVCSN